MATPDTSLSFLVDLPPEKAMQYLTDKGNHLAWDWQNTRPDLHARSFTVAKVASLDILADIRQAVQKSLDEGQTQRMFDKDLIPILQAKGWWGQKMVENPDGEQQLVQLGSLRRLETIYRTNLQTAYMAGRYQQMMEYSSSRPYWQYVAVMDGRTRPAHSALNGTVFRCDDPIWNHIFPPNGFRCRCRVTSLSESALQKEGLEVIDSKDYVTKLPTEPGDCISPSVSLKIPGMDQPFVPDPGWDHNPGKSWGRWDKAGLLPDCQEETVFAESGGSCLPLLPRQKTWQDYGRPDLRDVGNDSRLPAPLLLNPGKDAAEALSILQAALGVNEANPLRVIDTPVDPVAIRAEFLPHMVAKREQSREIFANYVIPTLENPYEIWLTAYADGLRKRYIGLFQDQRDMLSVVRENQDGSLLWNVIRMRDVDLNRQRTGGLIWKK